MSSSGYTKFTLCQSRGQDWPLFMSVLKLFKRTSFRTSKYRFHARWNCGHYGIRTRVFLLDRQAPHHSAPSARELSGVSPRQTYTPQQVIKERFLLFFCHFKTICLSISCCLLALSSSSPLLLHAGHTFPISFAERVFFFLTLGYTSPRYFSEKLPKKHPEADFGHKKTRTNLSGRMYIF